MRAYARASVSSLFASSRRGFCMLLMGVISCCHFRSSASTVSVYIPSCTPPRLSLLFHTNIELHDTNGVGLI